MMRTRFFMQILFIALATWLATGISAQASDPFVPVSQLWLPADLEGQNIRLEFDRVTRMAPSGVIRFDVELSSLVHKEGSEYTFHNDPDPFVNPDLNKNGYLWEIRLTRQSPFQEITIDPSDANGFRAFHSIGYQDEPAILFRWTGIQLPGLNSLKVELAVSLGDNDKVSRWYGRVEWVNQGENMRIEEFDYPITCFEPPVEPRAGENRYEALKRARLLIPSNLLFGEVATANISAESFFNAHDGLCTMDRTYKHPNPSQGDPVAQDLQFSVFYNGNTEEVGDGFRRMLYMGTEDETGHYKRFRYQGLGEKPLGSDLWTLRFGWRATHFPPYADVYAGATWHNTFDSPYPTVLGALLALDDAFWYDAAAYYRSFVEQKEFSGPLLDENLNIGASKGPSVWGFIASKTGIGGIDTYRSFLDLMLTFKEVAKNDYVPNDTAFMHWQMYMKKNPEEVRNPDYPVGSDVDPAVFDIIGEALYMYGIRTSLYTHAGRAKRSDQWWQTMFSSNAEAFGKDGLPIGDDTWAMLDFGGSEAWTVYPKYLYGGLASNLLATGAYLDTMSGEGASLSYDPPYPDLPTHIAHGGDYWTQGKIMATDNIRTAFQLNSPLATPSQRDIDVTLVSEGAEEYLTGHLDGVGQGYDWPPYYLLLAEDHIPWIEDTGLPPETTTWSAPLWNTVYHEWAPTTDQVIPFTNVGLITNEEYNGDPGDGTGPRWGMNRNELLDLYCFFYSAFYTQQGSNPAFFSYLKQFDSPLLTLDTYGELVVDSEKDPTRVGYEIADMLRTLYASQEADYAGQFLLSGRLLRPLQVDYADSNKVDLEINPAKPCYGTNPDCFLATFPTMLVHKLASDINITGKIPKFGFNVPAVLHSMWLSRTTGKMGLVLVNWTAGPAKWSGVFKPELYELPAYQTYSVDRLNLDGSPTVQASFSGTIEIHADAGASGGSDLYLGLLPAHSVVVLQFNY
ncbi:MAG: hypothetical protein ABIK28_14195 [Planctomycetota bacterium]